MLEIIVTKYCNKVVGAIPSERNGITYLIEEANASGLNVSIETQSNKQMDKVNNELISFKDIKEAWEIFVNNRRVNEADLSSLDVSSIFIMSLFNMLPFVESFVSENLIQIKLKEYYTNQLPRDSYQRMKVILEDFISEVFETRRDNKKDTESFNRQDLKLLGFIDGSNNINIDNVNDYIASNHKIDFIKTLLLKQVYFNVVLYCLEILREVSKVEKKKALEELGMLIVRNSQGENLMVESVAKKRTHNLLMWLENTKLIDQEWCPTENFFDTLNINEQVMTSNIRGSLLKVMNEYLAAKREGFGGHLIGSFVRNDIPLEFNNLPFIDSTQYVVTGSVGQGNWASVPWIAIMNRNITVSTQRGYYIGYLFSEDMQSVYLTLAQGVTETSREEMSKIKSEIHDSIFLSSKVRKDDDINLGSSKKARDYAMSTAAYIPYHFEDMPDESVLVADLEEMVRIYENFIAIKNGNLSKGYDNLNPTDKQESFVIEKEKVYITSKDLIDHIYSYIRSKGFLYRKEEVTNLFLSLKTKPFVILSGISGTGKTKMVQWFAESVGANEKNGQFTLIPVRPDWSDGSDLLGYVDIKGEFKEGPLTKAIKAAEGNPEYPYFVLLDEMNLARVEYYFSDILSVMESRMWEDGEIISSILLSKEIAGKDITLPNNLYVIGTVNMDETTHPFSKKVLDRANTIEFNRVELGNLNFLQELDDIEVIEIGQKQLSSKYLHLKDLYKTNSVLVERVTNELVKINLVLQLVNAHIGYRVRDEICFYVAYNEEGDLMPFERAFDHCILQKILPRITGSDSRVERLLKELYQLFTNTVYDDEIEGYDLDHQSALYPNSASKVAEMLGRLREDGFTSFWIS